MNLFLRGLKAIQTKVVYVLDSKRSSEKVKYSRPCADLTKIGVNGQESVVGISRGWNEL